MEKAYIIDRIEDGVITLISEEDGSMMNIASIDGFSVDERVIYENGILSHSDSPNHIKTADENKSRLNALFSRSKK